MPAVPGIDIPVDLLPTDGRFGSGPSRIPLDALADLAATGTTYLGTSHRQPTVRDVVGTIRSGLTELYALPDGYEVVVSNGGATAFWDAATFGLIEHRSAHFVCGEFSGKFAEVTTGAPFLDDPIVIDVPPPGAPAPTAVDGVDTAAYIHNETSTGVRAAFERFGDELVLVDGTSAAGAIPFDPMATDVYYFSPQKALASEGGLWCAFFSPDAITRTERIATTGRWTPPSLSLTTAIDNSRKDQTYNTPSLTTLFLLAHRIRAMIASGGLAAAAAVSEASADHVYGWAAAHPIAEPFVTDPALRSPTVATIDLDDIVDAAVVASVMRANGVVDIESYRKLGRNQLRIAMFPATPTEDIERLTASLDHVFTALVD